MFHGKSHTCLVGFFYFQSPSSWNWVMRQVFHISLFYKWIPLSQAYSVKFGTEEIPKSEHKWKPTKIKKTKRQKKISRSVETDKAEHSTGSLGFGLGLGVFFPQKKHVLWVRFFPLSGRERKELHPVASHPHTGAHLYGKVRVFPHSQKDGEGGKRGVSLPLPWWSCAEEGGEGHSAGEREAVPGR